MSSTLLVDCYSMRKRAAFDRACSSLNVITIVSSNSVKHVKSVSMTVIFAFDSSGLYITFASWVVGSPSVAMLQVDRVSP